MFGKTILASTIALFSLNLFAADTSLLPDFDTLQKAQAHNAKLKARKLRDDGDRIKPLRPYAEYEPMKYLMFSAKTSWGTQPIKETMMANMPDDVRVIVYVEWESQVENIRMYYTPIIGDEKQLRVIATNSYGNPFWTRDTLPVPVWVKENELGLVNARYYHNYEPDQVFADYFGVPLITHDYYYEGGNFIADDNGNCLLINKNTGAQLPEQVLKDSYGCATVTKLPFSAGIGHVDERLKLISDSVAFTDTPEYVKTLENLNFKVITLPRPQTYMGTYMNSLVLNDTVFLPIFGEPTDEIAIKAYEAEGLKVVPIRTNELVKGMGSIHCTTMTYPETKNMKLVW